MLDAASDRPLVGACLIVKDEAPRIEACLIALRGLADEVVLVDTGSSDDTIAIARRLGACVVESPWRDDFAFHRNESLDLARGWWSLVIDADERVVSSDFAETRRHLLDAVNGGATLPNILLVRLALSYPDGREVPLQAPRLLRTDRRIRFTFPVHEQLDVHGEDVLLSDVVMEHTGYRDRETLARKEQRNLRIAESMPPVPHALHTMARAASSLSDWPKVLGAARRLLSQPAPRVLRREVAVHGATAAFNSGSLATMAEMVGTLQGIDPDHLDSARMAAIYHLGRYLELASRSASHEDLIRPRLFHHDPTEIANALRALVAEPAAVKRSPDAR